jgi:hypothetical protein
MELKTGEETPSKLPPCPPGNVCRTADPGEPGEITFYVTEGNIMYLTDGC